MLLAGLALATLIGLTLGLLGGGGSILTVPVFVYVLGYAAKPAIAMSLPVVGVTSLVGALRHWRAGNVNLRVALMFGVVAMLGSVSGARFSSRLQGTTQLVLLGVVMLAAAVSMLRGGDVAPPPADAAMPRSRLLLLLVVGFGVGALTGVVGIGGGFLIVPALVLLARVPMKAAVGTSLLVIAMNSLSGFLALVGRVPVQWHVVALFTLFAIVGIFVGTSIARRVSAATLKQGFAVFLLALGALVLYQNRAVVTGATVTSRAR